MLIWIWIVIEWIVIIGGLFMLSYYYNKKRKRQSQIYSIIIETNSEIVPIQEIMSALQMDFSAVCKDINAMCINWNYPLLKNSHIDIGRQNLVLSKERLEKLRKKTQLQKRKQSGKEPTVIECKHCGAKNQKINGNECEYCGSPL